MHYILEFKNDQNFNLLSSETKYSSYVSAVIKSAVKGTRNYSENFCLSYHLLARYSASLSFKLMMIQIFFKIR